MYMMGHEEMVRSIAVVSCIGEVYITIFMKQLVLDIFGIQGYVPL